MTERTYNLSTDEIEFTGELTVPIPYTASENARHPSAVLAADGSVLVFYLRARTSSPFGGELIRAVAPDVTTFLSTPNASDADQTVLMNYTMSGSGLGGRDCSPSVWWGHNLVWDTMTDAPVPVDGPVLWMALRWGADQSTDFVETPGFTPLPSDLPFPAGPPATHLFTSTDEGLTWDHYCVVDDSGNVNTTINCTPWSPGILYVLPIVVDEQVTEWWVLTSMRGLISGTVRNLRPYIYVSTDQGATWTQHPPAEVSGGLGVDKTNNQGHSRNVVRWVNGGRWLYMNRRDLTGAGNNPDFWWWDSVTGSPDGANDSWFDYYDPDFNDEPPERRRIVNWLHASNGDVWGVLWRGDSLSGLTMRVYRSRGSSRILGTTDMDLLYESEEIPSGAISDFGPVVCKVGDWQVAMGGAYLIGLRVGDPLRFLLPLYIPHKKWLYETSTDIRIEHNRQNWLRVTSWANAARLGCLFHTPELRSDESREVNWVAVENWVRRCTPLSDMHIPYKRNPSPAQEERNWVYLEQWSRRVRAEPFRG